MGVMLILAMLLVGGFLLAFLMEWEGRALWLIAGNKCLYLHNRSSRAFLGDWYEPIWKARGRILLCDARSIRRLSEEGLQRYLSPDEIRCTIPRLRQHLEFDPSFMLNPKMCVLRNNDLYQQVRSSPRAFDCQHTFKPEF